jgi:hypothetical protein
MDLFARVRLVANLVLFGDCEGEDWILEYYEINGENIVATLAKWDHSEQVEFPLYILLQWNYTDLALELHEELNG